MWEIKLAFMKIAGLMLELKDKFCCGVAAKFID